MKKAPWNAAKKQDMKGPIGTRVWLPLVKRTLRLEGERCPDGYRIEKRAEGDFLVPRSDRLVAYARDFDRRLLVYLDFLNSLRRDARTGRLSEHIESYAGRWGLTDGNREVNLHEFLCRTLHTAYMQREVDVALVALELSVGTCHCCGDDFTRRIKPRKGEREFCQYKFDERGELIRAHCRQSFSNAAKKQKGALAPKRERVTWSPPNA